MLEFEGLVQEHLNALHRTALRITRNEHDAEDLVQEAVVKAFRHFDQFEKGTNFKAWLFKIMMNTYINSYRKKVKEPPMTDFASVEPVYEEIVKESTQFSLEQIETLRDKLSDEVSEALDRLPSEYRLVFLLAVIEDFTYQEISELLGTPIGTIMSRLFRARKMLREELLNYAKQNGIVKERTLKNEMS
jgi:RNA polymerase sigma-70 factor (ECF subfamily)